MHSSLYEMQIRLFDEGKYWESLLIASRIVVEYPDFEHNNKIYLKMSECFWNLGFYETALRFIEPIPVGTNEIEKEVITCKVMTVTDIAKVHEKYKNIKRDFPWLEEWNLDIIMLEAFLRSGMIEEAKKLLPKDKSHNLQTLSGSLEIKDTSLANAYHSGKATHEEFGVKAFELLMKNQNSLVIQQLDSLEKEIQPYLEIKAQYEAAWDAMLFDIKGEPKTPQ